MSAGYTFKDLNNLTKLLKVLLCILAAMSVLGLYSNWLQHELLARHSFTHHEAFANDLRQRFISVIVLILLLIIYIVFGRWIYLANQNIWAFGAQNLRFTPGLAVGYFFVPVFNYWKPYQAMKDLWRASKSPSSWQSVPTSSILGFWWGLWLIANFIGTAVFWDSHNAHTVQAIQVATVEFLALDFVRIPLCIVALRMVSDIQDSQNSAKESSIMPKLTPPQEPTTVAPFRY